MAKKADFNAEEWAAIVEAPLLAGMRVIAAGRGGTIRESLAIGETYKSARGRHGESELLDEILSSPPSVDAEKLRAAGDVERASDARLREAVRVLEQKASSEDVDAYRNFVLDAAEAAANAHREGGFLGVGGKQVSDTERAALDEITAALGNS